MGTLLFKDGVLQFRSGAPLIVDDPADCDCCEPPPCPPCNEYPPDFIVEFDGWGTPGCCTGIDLNGNSFTMDASVGVPCRVEYSFGTIGIEHVCEEVTFIAFYIYWESDYMYFTIFDGGSGNMLRWRAPYPDPENIDCYADVLTAEWEIVISPFSGGTCGINTGITFSLSLAP